MKIIHSIKCRINGFISETANAIDAGDWGLVARNTGLALLALFGVLGLALLLLVGIWKILSSFLGKILLSLFGTPLMLYILYLSYQANRGDSERIKKERSQKNYLEVWAEDMYGYVRDAVFLVLRAMSEYTVVVMPSTPSAIELPNGVSIKDGYAIFSFFARVRDTADVTQLKRELTRTLGQMLRAHELKGISSDLVQIKGSFYAPIQVLDIVDFGDSVNIMVVFANEKTVELVKARKLLHLEVPRRQQQRKNEVPYDDEI